MAGDGTCPHWTGQSSVLSATPRHPPPRVAAVAWASQNALSPKSRSPGHIYCRRCYGRAEESAVPAGHAVHQCGSDQACKACHPDRGTSEGPTFHNVCNHRQAVLTHAVSGGLPWARAAAIRTPCEPQWEEYLLVAPLHSCARRVGWKRGRERRDALWSRQHAVFDAVWSGAAGKRRCRSPAAARPLIAGTGAADSDVPGLLTVVPDTASAWGPQKGPPISHRACRRRRWVASVD